MAEKANIVNKLSLYDILTLIIPGSMVVAVLYAGMYPWIKSVEFSWIFDVAIIGVMYLLGLLIKNLALHFNKKHFEHNEDAIRDAYVKFAKETNHRLDVNMISYNDYCADYYYAIEVNISSKVAILEGQVAFLRTIRYTLLVIAVISAEIFFINTQQSSWNVDQIWLSFTIFFVALSVPPFFTCVARGIQKKVYESVIYDSFYHGGPISKKISGTE